MPAFDLTVQDKIYHVEIPSPTARPLHVIVDGQAFEVCISSAPGVADTVRPVETAPVMPKPAVQPPISAPAVASRAVQASASCGASGVTAPMPGTILSVEVKQGQKVEAGTVLCYLEAMKMKNPIRTPMAGVVAEVCTQAGQSVAYGQVLFHVEQGV